MYHIIGRCTEHCRIIWLILLFTHVTYFLVFQWNSTTSSTTSNDVIHVKPYWGCCLWILIICFLVRNIDTWTVGTAPQYTFPVWNFMIRLRICAHCSLFRIRCFGINMTSMWHQCILYVSYMWCDFSPDLLLWECWLWYLKFSNTYHTRIAMMNV